MNFWVSVYIYRNAFPKGLFQDIRRLITCRNLSPALFRWTPYHSGN